MNNSQNNFHFNNFSFPGPWPPVMATPWAPPPAAAEGNRENSHPSDAQLSQFPPPPPPPPLLVSYPYSAPYPAPFAPYGAMPLPLYPAPFAPYGAPAYPWYNAYPPTVFGGHHASVPTDPLQTPGAGPSTLPAPPGPQPAVSSQTDSGAAGPLTRGPRTTGPPQRRRTTSRKRKRDEQATDTQADAQEEGVQEEGAQEEGAQEEGAQEEGSSSELEAESQDTHRRCRPREKTIKFIYVDRFSPKKRNRDVTKSPWNCLLCTNGPFTKCWSLRTHLRTKHNIHTKPLSQLREVPAAATATPPALVGASPPPHEHASQSAQEVLHQTASSTAEYSSEFMSISDEDGARMLEQLLFILGCQVPDPSSHD